VQWIKPATASAVPFQRYQKQKRAFVSLAFEKMTGLIIK
jgi:hypothetical protein